ncbi:hypothetical protein ONZ45_g16582 [Pleurotus djamor]|nr:hypothetical protein ONZ45_g16582 [Pleurotus djamor]
MALQTPRLWTSVYLYPLERGHEVLRRAKGAPLDIHGLPPDDDPNVVAACISMMKTIFNEPGRISSINISVSKYSDEVSSTLSELIGTSSMPLLESIQIDSFPNQCRVLDDVLMTQESAPRLETLVLQNCRLDLTTPRFHQLRYLELESTLRPSPRITDLYSFISALAEMHNLERLKLTYVLPDEPDEDPLQAMMDAPVSLPSLRQVVILDDCVPLYILKCTRAPNVGRIDVTLYNCFDSDEASDNVQEISNFIAFRSPVVNTPEATEYHLEVHSSPSYMIMDYTRTTGGPATSKTISIQLDLLSEEFWSMVPLAPVATFSFHPSLDDDIPVEYFNYVRLLSQMDMVTTLKLPYNAFFKPNGPGMNFIGMWTNFPALKELFFSSLPHDEAATKQLLEWIRFRERRRLPRLKELSIPDQWEDSEDTDPSVIQTLKQSVDSLTTLSSSERIMQISQAENPGDFW